MLNLIRHGFVNIKQVQIIINALKEAGGDHFGLL
jgi:hypothetical protein